MHKLPSLRRNIANKKLEPVKLGRLAHQCHGYGDQLETLHKELSEFISAGCAISREDPSEKGNWGAVRLPTIPTLPVETPVVHRAETGKSAKAMLDPDAVWCIATHQGDESTNQKHISG